MREYWVNKFKYKVYDSKEDTPPSIHPIEDWRKG